MSVHVDADAVELVWQLVDPHALAELLTAAGLDPEAELLDELGRRAPGPPRVRGGRFVSRRRPRRPRRPELAGDPGDVPIRVHFDLGDTTTLTLRRLAELADSPKITARGRRARDRARRAHESRALEALSQLERAGYLTRRPDGDYQATFPEARP